MKPEKGICKICACVHDDPCEEGCAWTDQTMTLCTSCKDLTPLQIVEKRRENLDVLAMALSELTDQALEVKLRMSILEAPIATKRKPAARSQHPKFPKMGTR